MDFEWDEKKRQRNIVKHGVDPLYAASIFDAPFLVEKDERHDHGEDRFRATGFIDGVCYVVVFTRRGERVRLIGARLGGRRDRRRYQTSIA